VRDPLKGWTREDTALTDTFSIAVVGLDRVNALTAELGLSRTWIARDLGSMLDGMAVEVGFVDYRALACHDR
jgi:hypothetical protein